MIQHESSVQSDAESISIRRKKVIIKGMKSAKSVIKIETLKLEAGRPLTFGGNG